MDMDQDRRDLFKLLPAAGVLAGFGVSSAQAQSAPDSTWARITQTKTLRVGAAAYEPWYYKDPTKSDAPGGVMVGDTMWRGIGVGLGKEIADGLGVKLEVVETTWANAVAGLQANQFDVMFVLDATPTRALAIDFLSVPVGYYPLVLLAKDDLPGSEWKDFNDPKVRIAVQIGSIMDQFLTKNVPNATLTRFQDAGQTYAALQSGRADAICAVGPSLSLARARMGLGKIINPKPFVPLPAGTGLRWEPNNRFKDYLTAACSYLYSTQKVQEVYAQFLAFRKLDPKDFTSLIREQW